MHSSRAFPEAKKWKINTFTVGESEYEIIKTDLYHSCIPHIIICKANRKYVDFHTCKVGRLTNKK